MFAKLIIITILLLIVTNLVLAALPTQEQLDKYFVQFKLKVDNDIHYFYWKRIKSFDNDGVIIHYQIRHKDGTIEDKYNFLPKGNILNWDESLEKYKRLKETGQ